MSLPCSDQGETFSVDGKAHFIKSKSAMDPLGVRSRVDRIAASSARISSTDWTVGNSATLSLALGPQYTSNRRAADESPLWTRSPDRITDLRPPFALRYWI